MDSMIMRARTRAHVCARIYLINVRRARGLGHRYGGDDMSGVRNVRIDGEPGRVRFVLALFSGWWW